MKTIKDSMILAGSSLFLILFFAGTAPAQDTIKKKEVKKTIQIRIIEDENGNVKKLDTTFVVIDDMDAARDLEYRYRIKAYDDQERMMEDKMRDMEREMKEVEIYINDDPLKWVDSLADLTDTLEREIIIRHAPGAGPRGEMFRFRGGLPDFDFDFECPRGFEYPFEWQGMMPFGNIKEYKVKETKNGKRIIIEMEDTGNNVIIMHPRGNRHMHGPKRVIIEREIQSPPPPPAPPAPPAPDKG